MMMRNYLLIFMLLGLVSCDNWLNVKPNDRIAEETAFSTSSGFELALNGIYVDLNRTTLYGAELSYNMLEIMAQRYSVDEKYPYNNNVAQFKWAAQEAKYRVGNVWKDAYNLISNTNLLLKNCEEHREILSNEYYALIKGEALALRALLHFDLFRLWGPVYKEGTLNEETIPYYASFSLVPAPKKLAEEYMKQVIQDLIDAANLLQNYDPVKTGNTLTGNEANKFKGYRVLRMNYYAVKLLQARAYLYMKDKENAYKAAKEVIDVQEELFPWVLPAAIADNQDDPDRVFSTELVFALQNVKRKSIYTTYYDLENSKVGSTLSSREDVVNNIFDNEYHDYRYKSCLKKSVEDGGDSYKIFTKYMVASTDSIYNQLIPMLRVSEAFYIMAECEENPEDGVKWLNQVKNARGLNNVSAYYLEDEIENEYMREFWGEGQLFFYYKRLNYSKMLSGNEIWKYVDVTSNDYTPFIPEEESKYN